MFSAVLLLVVLDFVYLSVYSSPEDGVVRDCPRFDYEYKLLERILLLEHKTADIEGKQKVLEKKNEELVHILKKQGLDFEEMNKNKDIKMREMQDELNQHQIDYANATEQQIAEIVRKNNEQDIAREQMKTDLLTVLEQQKLELTRDNEVLQTAIAAMNAEWTESLIRMISETNNNHSVALHELATRMDNFEQDIGTKINHTHPSFTVRIQSTPRKVGDVLIFDSVLTNDDNMYNTATGTFQVKTTGKYMISVTLSTADRKNYEAGLMRDSQKLAAIEPDNQGNDNSSDNDTASVTVVVNLNAGDSVYVKSVNAATDLRGGQYNVFTGVLLS